jgi:hypothetical protein
MSILRVRKDVTLQRERVDMAILRSLKDVTLLTKEGACLN